MWTLSCTEPSLSSDQALRDRVAACFGACERLFLTGFRKLSLEISNGGLILRGVVSSYYQRQLVMTFCRRIPGVLRVVDEIEVRDGNVRPAPLDSLEPPLREALIAQ